EKMIVANKDATVKDKIKGLQSIKPFLMTCSKQDRRGLVRLLNLWGNNVHLLAMDINFTMQKTEKMLKPEELAEITL
ncbi:MAG: hypothetical protein Q8K36_06865, partial [Alphaproteobacteria bacterium]|nr:hypothetical protein [Alphaproteobacteria bacterium]